METSKILEKLENEFNDILIRKKRIEEEYNEIVKDKNRMLSAIEEIEGYSATKSEPKEEKNRFQGIPNLKHPISIQLSGNEKSAYCYICESTTSRIEVGVNSGNFICWGCFLRKEYHPEEKLIPVPDNIKIQFGKNIHRKELGIVLPSNHVLKYLNYNDFHKDYLLEYANPIMFIHNSMLILKKVDKEKLQVGDIFVFTSNEYPIEEACKDLHFYNIFINKNKYVCYNTEIYPIKVVQGEFNSPNIYKIIVKE